MKRIKGIGLGILSAVLVGSIAFALLVGFSPKVEYKEGYVSIGIGNTPIAKAATPYYLTLLEQGESTETLPSPTLSIRFNPSGTHVDNAGSLKIRLDFYPSEGDKSYDNQHIQLPIIPPEGYTGKVDANGEPISQIQYDTWLAGLPREWVVNPCLIVLVKVPRSITVGELDNFVKMAYNGNVTATIDDIRSSGDGSHQISPFMRDKTVLQDDKILPASKAQVISSVNSELSGYFLVESGAESTPFKVPPQSIDVGSPAIEYASSYPIRGVVVGDLNNPANADGTIDTVNVWFRFDHAAENITFGMLYNVVSANYTSRDHEYVGNVPVGSTQQVTGLNIDIVTNDVIGCTQSVAGSLTYIMRDTTGGTGMIALIGTFPVNNNTFTVTGNRRLSMNGTGSESGTPDIAVSPVSYNFGVIGAGSTTNTTTNYFTIANASTIQTDQTISVTTSTWSGGLGWKNSDAGTAGDNTSALYAYRTAWNVIVKNAAPNYIYENCPASTNYTWGLSLQAPTVFYDGAEKSITVRISAAAG